MTINTSNMIFVFGSNLAGIHGAGAARYARDFRGAQIGIGAGRTGQSYAIPTKGYWQEKSHSKKHVGQTLYLDIIKIYVDQFIKYARENPECEFQVTCIGCGLAGLKHEDIAPMFEDAPMNCWFDDLWKPLLIKSSHRFWGSF